MKKIFLLLTLIASVSCFGQTITTNNGFPTNSGVTLDNVFNSPESFQFTGTGTANFTSTAIVPISAYTAYYSNSFSVPWGNVAKLTSITFSCSQGALIFGTIYSNQAYNLGYNAKFSRQFNLIIPAGGGTVVMDVPDVLWEGGGIQYNFSSDTALAHAPACAVTVNGRMATNDLNYNAKYTYLVLGTSESWTNIGNQGSGTVPNPGKTLYANRIADTLRQLGISVRAINMGFGGSFSSDIVRAINERRFDGINPKLITIDCATNDAALDTATAQFTTNVETILNYFYAKDSTTSIVLIGPPPTDVASRVNNIASYRTYLQNIVSGGMYSNRDLHYEDAADIPVNDTNFFEQGSGNHLHLKGDTGHKLAFGDYWPGIAATTFYSNNH